MSQQNEIIKFNLNYIIMKNLKVGQTITFIKDNEEFKRKIHSIYTPSYNKEIVRYNTSGRYGGYGCDGFAVEPNEIIKTH